MSPLSRWAAVAASLLLPAYAAAQPPSMDELWPSTDGLSWTYVQHYEVFFPPQVVIDNRTRLFFAGPAVAPNGIQAQYLRQEPVGSVPMFTIAAESGLTDPLLQRLWIARPDLRQRMLAMAGGATCPTEAPQGSFALLLDGEFAWRKTAEEIAAWRCNLADTRAWMWLESNLTPGYEFTLQLVPDLADDVLLRGTIAGVEAVTVPAGSFDNCVRVDYVVDYGKSNCTDDVGNITGTFRSETRGYVDYAPDVGPVRSYEEFIPTAATEGSCEGKPGVGERGSLASMALESATTPARRSTWGQVKTAYR